MPPAADDAIQKSDAQPDSDTTQVAQQRCHRAIWWMIALYLVTAPLRYYEYIIYCYLPPACYHWGPSILIMLTLLIETYSLYLAIRYFRLPLFQNFYPFLVVIIAHYTFSMTNPNKINLQSYHSLFYKQREHVVQAYCAKKLTLIKRYSEHSFDLPLHWRHLAVADGIVEISCDQNRQTGLFLIWRGILDSWQGLLYQSDGLFPDDPDITEAHAITKIDKDWYFIDHSQKNHTSASPDNK
jgi:hypothetical protein